MPELYDVLSPAKWWGVGVVAMMVVSRPPFVVFGCSCTSIGDDSKICPSAATTGPPIKIWASGAALRTAPLSSCRVSLAGVVQFCSWRLPGSTRYTCGPGKKSVRALPSRGR
jgi:hypothetical protein